MFEAEEVDASMSVSEILAQVCVGPLASAAVSGQLLWGAQRLHKDEILINLSKGGAEGCLELTVVFEHVLPVGHFTSSQHIAGYKRDMWEWALDISTDGVAIWIETFWGESMSGNETHVGTISFVDGSDELELKFGRGDEGSSPFTIHASCDNGRGLLFRDFMKPLSQEQLLLVKG